MNKTTFPVILFLAVSLILVWRGYRRATRFEFIRSYRFPKGLYAGLMRKYPHLRERDCQLVSRGLRLFFLAYLRGGRRYVSMPSQAVDEVWHEFILNTREYAKFCKGAFGRFMHHTPAVVMSSDRKSNEGLRRCWWFSCKEENINPRNALRLPLLFAIDTKLQIPDGFVYAPNCQGQHKDGGVVHCGGDFSDTSFDGTCDGFGDSSSDGGSDGGGDGGGCGGVGD